MIVHIELLYTVTNGGGFWVKPFMTKNPPTSTDFRPSAENDNINLLTYPICIKCLSGVGFCVWGFPNPNPLLGASMNERFMSVCDRWERPDIIFTLDPLPACFE